MRSNKLKAFFEALRAEAAREDAVPALKELGERGAKLFDELSSRPLPQNRIRGQMFRISAMNEAEYGARVSDYKAFVESGFKQEYEYHYGTMHSIAESAKMFLVNNWRKVKDWSRLSVAITDNTGDTTEYFNDEKREHKHELNEGPDASILDRAFLNLEAYYAEKHNPVVELSEMVLDHSDGDFSVCINGHWHNWIDDDSIVMIADYVEEELAEQAKSVETSST